MSEHDTVRSMRHYGTARDPFADQEAKVQAYVDNLGASRGTGFAVAQHVAVRPVEVAPNPCEGCFFEEALLRPQTLLRIMKHRNGGKLGGVNLH